MLSNLASAAATTQASSIETSNSRAAIENQRISNRYNKNNESNKQITTMISSSDISNNIDEVVPSKRDSILKRASSSGK